MNRFAKKEFDPNARPTIGVDFMPAVIEINEQTYNLSFWVHHFINSWLFDFFKDTAGAEANGMSALAPMYYRNAEGVLLGRFGSCRVPNHLI